MGKRGPKPKADFRGKTSAFSTRITPDTRKKLERAARASGRSISHEAEHRLAQSLSGEECRILDFGTHETYGACLMIAKAVTNVEDWTGRQWWEDAFTFEEARKAISIVMAAFAPGRGSADTPPDTFPSYPAPGVQMGRDLVEAMGRDVLKRGLGRVAGEQVVRLTQTADEYVKNSLFDAAAIRERAPFGSSWRIALESKAHAGSRITLPRDAYEDSPMYAIDDFLTLSGELRLRRASPSEVKKKPGRKAVTK